MTIVTTHLNIYTIFRDLFNRLFQLFIALLQI